RAIPRSSCASSLLRRSTELIRGNVEPRSLRVMPSRPGTPRPCGDRRGRRLRPCFVCLEPRAVPSLTFPGIAGITFDASGDVFVSYDSTTSSSGQQQSVAEVASNGFLVNASVFGTTGPSAFPGALTTVGASAALPSLNSSGDILELQPDGQ